MPSSTPTPSDSTSVKPSTLPSTEKLAVVGMPSGREAASMSTPHSASNSPSPPPTRASSADSTSI